MAQDTRSLTQQEQDERRRQGIALVKAGRSQASVARELRVRPATVCAWMRIVRYRPDRAGSSKKRGPKAYQNQYIRPWQAKRIRQAIYEGDPITSKLRYPIWTPGVVQDFVEKRYAIRISIQTVYKYLRRWDLVPHNARYGGGGPAVIKTFKSVQKEACKAGAAVWFQCQRQRKDGNLSQVLFAARSRGDCAFATHADPLTPQVFLDFIQRICELEGRLVYLLLDGHGIHKNKILKHWEANHPHRLRVFFCDGTDGISAHSMT